MSSEFELIAKFFTRACPSAQLGVGDDAALIAPTPGKELAISADMLVAGSHFLPDTDPVALGHKALAVNLSDLAAMGAVPRWVLLSLSLPQADEAWLAQFSGGFLALADEYGVELIGGDTTRGPLNLSVTILGEVEPGQALRRDAAQVGDEIWVSGELGGAALGLQHLLGERSLEPAESEACLARLHRPSPRVALGRKLIGVAHACIDISDGLLADLGHILERSSVGAEIHLASLPLAEAASKRLAQPEVMRAALAGGDDYELCFTAPAERAAAVMQAAAAVGVAVTRIGRIKHDAGIRLLGVEGRELPMQASGFDHFAGR
ncbi:MAG: thiamine-phosphate kinase [Hydrogenophilaceae bacterium]|nr:thiamine-phosphate kinase [Hydrogenophilaceae bacterium]